MGVSLVQAVDVVGQAGKPKTITGFQTHKTPVLLAYGERAEMATDECILNSYICSCEKSTVCDLNSACVLYDSSTEGSCRYPPDPHPGRVRDFEKEPRLRAVAKTLSLFHSNVMRHTLTPYHYLIYTIIILCESIIVIMR